MRIITLFLFISAFSSTRVYPQDVVPDPDKTAIYTLIEMYVLARETKDTITLNKILTSDADQLVSSGNWRHNREEAVEGMLRSTANNPGKRTLTIQKLRFLNAGCALVDCKYQISNANGTERNMWSSFIVIDREGKWKISAIRNMLPAVPQ